MARARLVVDAVRYTLLIEEEALMRFKRAANEAGSKPTVIARTLLKDYTEAHECGDKHRLRVDIVYGILDQVDLLSDRTGRFKLNDLVCAESLKFVKEIRACNAAYLHGLIPKKYIFSLANREYVTMKWIDGSCIFTSSAHDCVITVKGYFLYVNMPRSFIDNTDNYARYCMVNDLLVTLSELTLDYRDQLIEVLGRLNTVPKLSNKKY